MKIRYAKPSDFNFLIEGLEKNRVLEGRAKKDIKAKPLDKQRFRTGIKKKTIRVVEDEGKSIGFVYFRTDFKVMYIYEKFFWVDLIYVDKKHRRKGLGKLLYKDVFKIAKKKGYKKIIIDIFEKNNKSLGFHEKIGFKPLYTIYEKKIGR